MPHLRHRVINHKYTHLTKETINLAQQKQSQGSWRRLRWVQPQHAPATPCTPTLDAPALIQSISQATRAGPPKWGPMTADEVPELPCGCWLGARLCHVCCPRCNSISKGATTACSAGLGFHLKYLVLPPAPSVSTAPLSCLCHGMKVTSHHWEIPTRLAQPFHKVISSI